MEQELIRLRAESTRALVLDNEIELLKGKLGQFDNEIIRNLDYIKSL